MPKHSKPDYVPPAITELGQADEVALATIRAAFANLTEAGIKVTVTRLIEEVRRIDQKTPNVTLFAAVDRFTKEESRP